VVTGMFAADLAEAGFTGYPNTLDMPILYDGNGIGADLGGTFMIDRTYIKPYGCCRFMHSALDGFFQLMGENGLAADDITGVHVDGFTALVNLNNKLDPPNFEASQFSVPFAFAVAAIEGKDGLAPLKPDLLGRADLIGFAGRVTMSVDPAIDALYPAQAASRVTIEARQGTFQGYVEDPLGDPANPLGRSGIQDKFRRLAGQHLKADRVETMIEASSSLTDGGLGTLLGALSAPLTTA
jgi:2-methylcitrate dehydratase PrpD